MAWLSSHKIGMFAYELHQMMAEKSMKLLNSGWVQNLVNRDTRYPI